MKSFDGLTHGAKIISRKTGVVFGWHDVNGERFVLAEGIGFPVSSINPEEFELYAGKKEIGAVDANYRFGADVAERSCPRCFEAMEASWSFCPWCGAVIPEA